jgi:hypothetical protein
MKYTKHSLQTNQAHTQEGVPALYYYSDLSRRDKFVCITKSLEGIYGLNTDFLHAGYIWIQNCFTSCQRQGAMNTLGIYSHGHKIFSEQKVICMSYLCLITLHYTYATSMSQSQKLSYVLYWNLKTGNRLLRWRIVMFRKDVNSNLEVQCTYLVRLCMLYF